MIYPSNREISLVEQKKLQWAKEKEELSKLSESLSPFSSSTSRKVERTSIRTFYSNVDLSHKYRSEGESSVLSTPHHYGDSRDDYYSHYEDLNERVRSPSLPPIDRGGKNRYTKQTQASADEDTSGYLSDSANQCESPDVWINTERGRPRMRLPNENRKSNEHSKNSDKNQRQRSIQKQYKSEPQPIHFNNKKHENVNSYRGRRSLDDETDIEPETDVSVPNGYGIPSSNSSDISREFSTSPAYGNSVYRKNRDERAKWGDRGVTVGHFYDPVIKDGEGSGPVWLERGLHDTRDSGDESVTSYSFIRGQNAPIDPNTLAERATKRLKALEFQNAIKEQLAERETQRRREIEIRRKEERRQEELLKQQLELESRQAQQEQRRQQEKMEKEMRKREILVQALERAAEDAKREKERRRRERGIITPCQDNDQFTDRKMASENIVSECTSQDKHDNDKVAEENEKTVPKNIDKGMAEQSEKNDEEKILIGSPIRLRKKNVPQKTKRTTPLSKEGSMRPDCIKDEMDGIALLLQPLQPFVPVAFKDTTEFPNLQFAVMLAHQFPQYTPMNLNVMNMDNYQVAPSTAPAKITNNFEMARNSSSSQDDCDQNETVKCNICGKNQRPEIVNEEHVDDDAEKDQVKDIFVLPHDGTFTKESSDSANIDNVSYTKETNDVSTQTEVAVCDLCGCKHNIDPEFDEMPVQLTLSAAEKDEECSEIEKETTTYTTTTTTTTTMIRSKTKDQKLATRPKWGVNRPVNQYVKASERDPFYLRNKRNKFKKRSQTESDVITDNSSRSTSPSITSPPPSTANKSISGQKLSRNVCTEILPIKTDVNGKIFLNFREASVVMTEDEIKQNLRQRYCRMERIMNRRKTSNEIMDDLNAKGQHKERETLNQKNMGDGRVEMPVLKKTESFKVLSKRSSADVDIESY